MKAILRKVSLLAITVLTAASLNASNIIVGNRNNAAKFNNQKVTRNRELRGVWVASVSNIDWPSKKGLSVDQQKAIVAATEYASRNGIVLKLYTTE